jgi:Protein of unknown function (DUF2510)
MSTTAAWHPDPLKWHQLRYWDGDKWTDYVSDDGADRRFNEPWTAPRTCHAALRIHISASTRLPHAGRWD